MRMMKKNERRTLKTANCMLRTMEMATKRSTLFSINCSRIGSQIRNEKPKLIKRNETRETISKEAATRKKKAIFPKVLGNYIYLCMYVYVCEECSAPDKNI